MSADDVAGELRSGMTVGIGGWGSRRKPMALVRAILRSGLRDLEIVSYGGPDVGLLVAGGHVRRVVCGFASLDTIPLEPHFRLGRQQGTAGLTELDEGMLHWGLLAAAHRLPFLPIRAGLGSDVQRVNPELRTVRSPYADGEELIAMPALRLDAALIHLNRADAAGNGQYLGPDPYFDDLFCLAAGRAYLSCEQIVPTASLLESGPPQSLLVNRAMVDGVVEAPGGAHFTSCVPDYGRDEAFQARYAAAAANPARLAAVPGRVPGRRRGQLPAGGAPVRREPGRHHRADGGPMTAPAPDGPPSPAVDGRKVPTEEHQTSIHERPAAGPAAGPASSGESGPSRAEVCVVACAEAWRGDGTILASPMGLIPTLGARLAQLTFSPRLLLTDGEAYLLAPSDSVARPAGDGEGRVVEGWLPYRSVFTMVAAGRRHVMMGAAQIDRFGNQNISCIGDWARPKAQLLGVRGAPGNTINHPVSYWVPRHSRRVFVGRVDMVSGVGYDRAAGLGPQAARFHELRMVVTDLAVLDFQTPDHAMRLRSVHPGVTAGDVIAATGFPLAVPDDPPATRLPTPEELALIRGQLDPPGLREKELP